MSDFLVEAVLAVTAFVVIGFITYAVLWCADVHKIYKAYENDDE